MYQRVSKRMSTGREDGFTLIELLIVIVILGVLAGIVVFAVGSASGDSKVSACKADKKTVNTASEAYKAKNGAAAADIATLVSGGFLKSAPPTGDYTITYTVTGTGAASVGTATGAVGATAC